MAYYNIALRKSQSFCFDDLDVLISYHLLFLFNTPKFDFQDATTILNTKKPSREDTAFSILTNPYAADKQS